MRLGIFAKTFDRPDVAGCLDAVAQAGITATQFNLSVAGLPTVPEQPVPTETITSIRAAADRSGVTLDAISGTFNAAHPDPARRRRDLDRFPYLCVAARELDIPIITLSSGSRDPDDMWRWHADNASPQAWSDSRDSLTELAGIAEEHDLKLAVEPEHSNVVATADQAISMLTQVGSARLGIIYDAANLLDPASFDLGAAREAIRRDIDTLAADLTLAHAKELIAGRSAAAPGAGLLPWDFVVARLAEAGFDGTLVTHGLLEADVPLAVQTLTAALRSPTRA